MALLHIRKSVGSRLKEVVILLYLQWWSHVWSAHIWSIHIWSAHIWGAVASSGSPPPGTRQERPGASPAKLRKMIKGPQQSWEPNAALSWTAPAFIRF